MKTIPENSLFNPEQNTAINHLVSTLTSDQALWLSGFLASHAQSAPAAAAPAKKIPLTILYGTESGNAEVLAASAKKEAQKQGFKATLQDMADVEPSALQKMANILVIVSTWGEGDPPERATEFYQALMGDQAPKFEKTHFSVCGLGDTSYEHFCQIGKDIDRRLEELGATRIAPRVDCDVDYESAYAQWFKAAMTSLAELTQATASAAAPSTAVGLPTTSAYDKANPFSAELKERIVLNGTGSAKETVHLEISLEGSGLQYLPGDCLGVKPSNCSDYVDALLKTVGFKGDESINTPNGQARPIREALIEDLDATQLSRPWVQKYAELASSEKLNALIKNSKQLKEYLWGREIIDILGDYPVADLSPQAFVDLLRPLPPRLYSIASSLAANPDEVHLTVAAVRYDAHGRQRKGVTSTYLADRIADGGNLPVYIHTNKHFRLPDNTDTPIIMVGPGTGIAPFRAFLQERAETGASGKNWLFFGDQHYSYDFLYQLEWQDFLKDGILSKLDVAFSRDTQEKVYVQHKMEENSKELFAWLEQGAHFYVCGDASKMAKDVHQTLLSIIANEGEMDAPAAKKYLSKLQKEKRYQRDVY